MNSAQKTAVVIFFALLCVCIALIALSDLVFGPVARAAVLPVATDGFKMVLGAIVGAASALLGTSRKEN